MWCHGDSTIVTWGNPDAGGDSSTVRDQLRGVQQIKATDHAFAAVLADGSVVTWGDADAGGDSSTVRDQLRGVQQIKATDHAFAAVLADGSVVTWGDADAGGDSSTVRDQLRGVQQIQATDAAFSAILADGSVVTWGDADAGGDSSTVRDQLRGVQQIQATDDAFAAVLADGSVITWGHANAGGDSSTVRDQLRGVQQIQATGYAFAAIGTTTKNLNATVSGDVVGLTHNISCNSTALSRPKSFHWPQVDSENVQGFNKKVEQSQPQDKTTQFCKLFGIAVLVCLIYCADNEGTPEPFGHRKTIKKKHKKHRHKHHAPSLSAIQKIRPARMCGTKRVKAPRLRTRRKARHFWLNRVVPKYGTKTKRKNIQEACNPPNWRHFAGGHGGGSATTKRKREERQNTSLADMLQETLSAWQQQQQQQGHWKSPKKKQQRQTHTTQPPESGLLSTLEAILQQCRQRQDDDNAVAEAIQYALQTHSDSDQTGQKDTKNDNSWYKKEGSLEQEVGRLGSAVVAVV